MKPMPWYFYLLILSLPSFSYAQTYWIPATPLFNFLYQLDKPVSAITNQDGEHFLPIALNGKPTDQYLIRDNNGFYIMIGGTGQVYKAIARKNNQIGFMRMDSTFYSGYNFGAIDFSCKDTLFSFGGYGFWRTNGQLRFYNESTEWNITRINKEYPVVYCTFNYLPAVSKLFYIRRPTLNQATSDKLNDYQVIELNINARKNTPLGKMHISWISANLGIHLFINAPSLNGTLVDLNDGLVLVNFSKNIVYKAISAKLHNEIFRLSDRLVKNTFEFENKIYFNLYPDTTLYSVPVSINDFAKEPTPLYEPLTGNSSWIRLIILAGIIIITSSLLVYSIVKRRASQKNIVNDREDNSKPAGTNESAFDALETQLIKQIIEKSKKGSGLSVVEINSLLGLSKKTAEIQKKNRSEKINHINNKFKIVFNTGQDLIQSIRSEDDKRYINY
ncbi:MAG TPA: hypothetical protein VIU45_02600, partial [Chitinophagaceae bacterium]